jgi:hypothetical protein
MVALVKGIDYAIEHSSGEKRETLERVLEALEILFKSE